MNTDPKHRSLFLFAGNDRAVQGAAGELRAGEEGAALPERAGAGRGQETRHPVRITPG
jgi:hypothetical protein